MADGKNSIAPPAIRALVARFGEQRDSYAHPSYKEAQLRKEFIDPMWKTLGWDMDNSQGHAEQYKEVIHEDAIKMSSSVYSKAPDYCFRIGGVRKFFLEAKKPAVDIAGDPDPAFQLRSYAWSEKLPLSVLTDFEELSVYDTRIKPAATDKASAARILAIRFTDYVEKWDEIAGIFSKDAILKGSFDKYAETAKKKRGTTTVDEDFLDQIEAWRDELARNIATRNKDLTQAELNFAVQVTIDRIVFLRICEDRGIEDYQTLFATSNGANIYPRLVELFRRADRKYNSGLFHFSAEKGRTAAPDALTPHLDIDDAVVRKILRSLYYPESPYVFSALPADILGQVYEQFLGKVIRLTPGHQAKVEEKPEIKKAGGVYYTPTYIVDYIVKHTIGPLLDGKTPKQVGGGKEGPIRILDPACGSGTFLLQAYQYLLDWYRDAYVKEGTDKHWKGKSPVLYQGKGGEWRLTTSERKRILLTHIFGVDIDYQAVEVTKLSLLLKVLEGESDQTLQRVFQLFHERALPDLDSNIKTGNSLVASDFFEEAELQLGDEGIDRVSPFHWQKEFPSVFGAHGGFDAIIGNPPYVRMEVFKDLKRYLKEHYRVHDERSDIYAYFVERGHSLLNKNGRFSMILSNKFLRANYGQPVRRFLSETTHIERVLDLAGLPVFQGATVRTAIFVTRLKAALNVGPSLLYSPPPDLSDFRAVESGRLSLEAATSDGIYDVPQDSLSDTPWAFKRPEAHHLLLRLQNGNVKLADYLDVPICYGVKSGLVAAFVLPADEGRELRKVSANDAHLIRPYLIGRAIRRYGPVTHSLDLIYTPRGVDISGADAVLRHLRPFREQLMKRATKQEWYELQQGQERYVGLMNQPKIVYPDIAKECRFTLDYGDHICGDTSFAIPVEDKALLAVLNSRLGFFYFETSCAALEGSNDSYLRFKLQYVENFPVAKGIKSIATKLEALVDRVLLLTRDHANQRTNQDRKSLENQIGALDREIDRLVYDLYGLVDHEIAIIESAAIS